MVAFDVLYMVARKYVTDRCLTTLNWSKQWMFFIGNCLHVLMPFGTFVYSIIHV